MIKIEVSTYCSYIWLAIDFDFSVFLQVLSKVVSSELDPLIKGCSKFAVVQSTIIQSACPLV